MRRRRYENYTAFLSQMNDEGLYIDSKMIIMFFPRRIMP